MYTSTSRSSVFIVFRQLIKKYCWSNFDFDGMSGAVALSVVKDIRHMIINICST